MKKWFDYQMQTQVKNLDWENHVHKMPSIAEPLSEIFEKIKTGFHDGSLKSQKRNVYINQEWIRKAITGTGGEVTENEYRTWLLEYPELVMGHGHQYISEFGDFEAELYETYSKFYNLKPDTVGIRVHIEQPGQYFMLHLDRNLYNRWQVSTEEPTYKENTAYHTRNVILTFMNDQELGQMVQFGRQNITWNKGDSITFEHQSVPHCTANVGFHTNFYMAVTGEVIKD
jgi:hypothetical protein